ncbi:hypothetical protein ABTH87_19260, partial [Acinetobacter baumannii]
MAAVGAGGVAALAGSCPTGVQAGVTGTGAGVVWTGGGGVTAPRDGLRSASIAVLGSIDWTCAAA